jgi:hypothetical protein
LPEATQSGPSLGIERNLSLIVQDYHLRNGLLAGTVLRRPKEAGRWTTEADGLPTRYGAILTILPPRPSLWRAGEAIHILDREVGETVHYLD